MMKILKYILLCALMLVSVASAAEVNVVAESTYQWTGLAISSQGRMFVCYPTWRRYPAYKVAEIKAGEAVPFPEVSVAKSFSCVQSVYVDRDNNLWILDTGKPRGQAAKAGTAKLYKVDLTTNKVVWSYAFPADVDLATSYLNDVRVDTVRNYAYLTDSAQGGIVVVNLAQGKSASWRALDNIPQVKADLLGIDFKSTGFDKHQTHSDGIALSQDGAWLYFSPMTGKSIYKIATAKLRNRNLSVSDRAKAIKTVTNQSVPTDGLWLQADKLYMGDLPHEGLYVYDLKKQQGHELKLNQAIHWADSFAEDAQGRIYFTTSQINYRDQIPEAYRIYRLSE